MVVPGQGDKLSKPVSDTVSGIQTREKKRPIVTKGRELSPHMALVVPQVLPQDSQLKNPSSNKIKSLVGFQPSFSQSMAMSLS